MKLLRRKKPQQVERRKPENADLRRQIDVGQKQTAEYRIDDAARRVEGVETRLRLFQTQAPVMRRPQKPSIPWLLPSTWNLLPLRFSWSAPPPVPRLLAS